MNKIQQQINHATRQMKVHGLYVLYWNAMITSGGYKQIDSYRGATSSNSERPSTEEEKLQDALNSMKAHIHHFIAAHDFLGEMESG